MNFFKSVEYWKRFSIPVIKIDNYHYIFINNVMDILDPVELTLNNSVYTCDKTKLLTCVFDENESYEVFVPIELLSRYIVLKET